MLNELERLDLLYKQADECSEDVPRELAKQIETYAKILHVTGRLYATSVFRYGKAYAERKAKWGRLAKSADGSGTVKEATADEGTEHERVEEAKAEAEMKRWEKDYSSIEELIQAKKKSLDVLMKER